MTALTIQIDDELMARAGKLAAARQMTVAAMLERLLRVLAESPLARNDLPPLTREALGVLPTMSDEQAEQILDEERTRKYGSR
jgi:hypothetical protein